MVEIAGFFLISCSKSATDMLLNSSATIFLAEVDGLLIELVMTSVAKYYGLQVELDFAGISFLGVLKDSSKDDGASKKDGSAVIANHENPMNKSSLTNNNKSAIENKIKAKQEAKKNGEIA
jgi:hypothetical protein